MKTKLQKEDIQRIEELKKQNRCIPIKQGSVVIDVIVMRGGEQV